MDWLARAEGDYVCFTADGLCYWACYLFNRCAAHLEHQGAGLGPGDCRHVRRREAQTQDPTGAWLRGPGRRRFHPRHVCCTQVSFIGCKSAEATLLLQPQVEASGLFVTGGATLIFETELIAINGQK